MVAFYPHFVSCGEKATLKDVVGKLNDLNSIISLVFYGSTLLASLKELQDERLKWSFSVDSLDEEERWKYANELA